MHLWFFVLFSTFAVLPAAYACAVWIGGSAIYYLSTIFGEPEHTGDPFTLMLIVTESERL